MTAEKYPSSLVDQLAILEHTLIPHAYYRSKLFIAPNSTNILVSAAGPILSLLERLCLSASLPSIELIKDNVEHEIKAFRSKLAAAKYPIDFIKIANYLISATIDELLGKSYLRLYNSAPEFTAFTPASTDGAQPEKRFFEILSHLEERPNQYLDLIELIYFCLTAGFEGQYHLRADGRQSLDNQIENLYQIIQQYRVHKPHRLFNENPLPKIVKTTYKQSYIAMGLALGLMVFSFFSSHIILDNKAKTVLFAYTQLAASEQ